MCSQHLHLKRVDLHGSLTRKKKKKKKYIYLPPSSYFEKPPDEKQLCFLCCLKQCRNCGELNDLTRKTENWAPDDAMEHYFGAFDDAMGKLETLAMMKLGPLPA